MQSAVCVENVSGEDRSLTQEHLLYAAFPPLTIQVNETNICAGDSRCSRKPQVQPGAACWRGREGGWKMESGKQDALFVRSRVSVCRCLAESYNLYLLNTVPSVSMESSTMALRQCVHQMAPPLLREASEKGNKCGICLQ